MVDLMFKWLEEYDGNLEKTKDESNEVSVFASNSYVSLILRFVGH